MSSDVISMPKRFDYSSGSQFNSALELAVEQHALVTLDCANMEYLDSAGIGLLVMANKRAQNKNSKLVMSNLRSAPREILNLANIQKLIELKP